MVGSAIVWYEYSAENSVSVRLLSRNRTINATSLRISNKPAHFRTGYERVQAVQLMVPCAVP